MADLHWEAIGLIQSSLQNCFYARWSELTGIHDESMYSLEVLIGERKI